MQDLIKEWFRHALIQDNQNYEGFGISLTPPVSRQMVTRVLAGSATSPRVENAILDYCRSKLPVIHARLENFKKNNHPLYVENLI